MEKEKEEKRGKKRKKNKKIKIKIVTLCLETRARSEGYWRKPLKPGALNLHWLGVADLVFATWVDGWSLESCRCWSLEIIRSPG